MSNPFELTGLNLVATITHSSKSETCEICKTKLNLMCATCEATKSSAACECVQGVCEHSYHKHCIEEWLKKSKVCPLDRKTWIYKVVH
ncbi:MAG: E3 ubiquitin-protein ligase RBX1 [Faunusvirus sp.]|uniref:E3 ubiquitin-protein ligase RBX1 n=1 Tax=Faunusvirus sp. TaxID=2487766 RepID=A0A3G4ZWJ2_9VIRU|nr:MAG: E3 ubiquitin-protein ligase RBX1 [Faunusvirus sp.]